MAIWGLNLPVMKVLITAHDPLAVGALRMLLGTLALYALLRLRTLPRLAFTPRQWLGLAACAGAMVYLNQLLLMGGMQRSTATNASLLMAAGPLMATALGAAVFGEAFTRARLAGIALGFAGVAMVVLHRPGAAMGEAGLGDLMIVGAVGCYALGGVFVQRLARHLAPESISVAVHGLGAAMLLAHVLAWRHDEAQRMLQSMTPWLWVLALFSSVLATAIGNLVWHRAIAHRGAGRTSLYVYWVPVFGVAFSVLLLGEPLTFWLLAGGALVMAGTWLGSRRPAAS
jgi:drug/metabolite transporter (DMT)-like permease